MTSTVPWRTPRHRVALAGSSAAEAVTVDIDWLTRAVNCISVARIAADLWQPPTPGLPYGTTTLVGADQRTDNRAIGLTRSNAPFGRLFLYIQQNYRPIELRDDQPPHRRPASGADTEGVTLATAAVTQRGHRIAPVASSRLEGRGIPSLPYLAVDPAVAREFSTSGASLPGTQHPGSPSGVRELFSCHSDMASLSSRSNPILIESVGRPDRYRPAGRWPLRRPDSQVSPLQLARRPPSGALQRDP